MNGAANFAKVSNTKYKVCSASFFSVLPAGFWNLRRDRRTNQLESSFTKFSIARAAATTSYSSKFSDTVMIKEFNKDNIHLSRMFLGLKFLFGLNFLSV